jgi:hypothetical protein
VPSGDSLARHADDIIGGFQIIDHASLAILWAEARPSGLASALDSCHRLHIFDLHRYDVLVAVCGRPARKK